MGGLARFDYIFGEKDGIIVYADNNLNLHRTKLENADKLYENHVGELLQPPSKETLENLPKLVRFEFKVAQKSDLVFSGLGWITIPSGSVVAGWAPKGVAVTIRRAMI